MKKNNHLLVYIMVSGFLFFIDQLLKYFARINQGYSFYLWKPWLGWEYFGNTGIGFSLPVPNWLVVVVTPMVLLGLIYWFFKTYKSKPFIIYHLSFILIIFGAVSNYIDRVLFGITIDYLRLLTGIFNLADLMIIIGVIILVVNIKKKTV